MKWFPAVVFAFLFLASQGYSANRCAILIAVPPINTVDSPYNQLPYFRNYLAIPRRPMIYVGQARASLSTYSTVLSAEGETVRPLEEIVRPIASGHIVEFRPGTHNVFHKHFIKGLNLDGTVRVLDRGPESAPRLLYLDWFDRTFRLKSVDVDTGMVDTTWLESLPAAGYGYFGIPRFVAGSDLIYASYQNATEEGVAFVDLSGNLVRKFNEEFGIVYHVNGPPDGKTVAIHCEKGVFLADLENDDLRPLSLDRTFTSFFSPDGERVGLIHVDSMENIHVAVPGEEVPLHSRYLGEIELFETESGDSIGTIPYTAHDPRPMFIGDKSRLWLNGTNESRIFELGDGDEIPHRLIATLEHKSDDVRLDESTWQPLDNGEWRLVTVTKKGTLIVWDEDLRPLGSMEILRSMYQARSLITGAQGDRLFVSSFDREHALHWYFDPLPVESLNRWRHAEHPWRITRTEGRFSRTVLEVLP